MVSGTMAAVTAESNSIARVSAALLRVRWIVRAPIWLFRARLGFLFGTRLLMLEHVGRSSGLRRQVVLEIVDHPTPSRHVVVSGFGGPRAMVPQRWGRTTSSRLLRQPQARISNGTPTRLECVRRVTASLCRRASPGLGQAAPGPRRDSWCEYREGRDRTADDRNRPGRFSPIGAEPPVADPQLERVQVPHSAG